MQSDEHQAQMDERRRVEDEAIARAKKWRHYHKRVLRTWFKAFDNRMERHRNERR